MNVIRLSCVIVLFSLLISTATQAQDQPPLADWLNKTLSQHPEILSAQSAIDATSALGRAANKPLYNPEIELEYEKTDVRTRTAGISQTIDWGDKQSSLSLIAQYEFEGAKAALRFKKQTLAAEILSALGQYQSSQALNAIDAHRQDLMSRFQSLAERRFGTGDLPQIERDLARLAYAEARFQLANTKAAHIEASQMLDALLGEDPGTLPDLPATPGAISESIPDAQKLIDQLPAMRQARAEMDVNRIRVQLAQREQRPDPTLGFVAGKEGDETLTGVTLAIPLYVRNNYQAEVDAANAQHIVKQREAMNLRRQLHARLKSAAATYRINREVWLQWLETGKQSLEQQSQLLDRLWRAGEINTTDYLVQLKQALDTQASAIEQQGQLWQAWIEWLSASGAINQWLEN